MVMRLKDLGKLPHAKIPLSQTWQQQHTTEPSLASQPRSLPGTMKRR